MQLHILQACKDYHKMLLEVYGPTKVLSPYVLNIDAISDYNAKGKLFLTMPIIALMQSHHTVSHAISS